jgi:serine phosphatase RsbU (regulator of sigma subunit)
MQVSDPQSYPSDRAPLYRLLRRMHNDALAIRDRPSPAALPAVDGIDCCAHCRRGASRGAAAGSGDFFEVAAPRRNHLVIALGNIAAKGAAGPILTTAVRAALRFLIGHGAEIATTACELNSEMWDMAPDNTFAGLFLARLDPLAGRIHYVNAGHESALLIHAGGRIERLEPHAPVLGLSRRSQYHEKSARFAPGDTFIALSEGAGEAADRLLRSFPLTAIEPLSEKIVESGDPAVDRTVIVARRRPSAGSPVRSGFAYPRGRLSAVAA